MKLSEDQRTKLYSRVVIDISYVADGHLTLEQIKEIADQTLWHVEVAEVSKT